MPKLHGVELTAEARQQLRDLTRRGTASAPAD